MSVTSFQFKRHHDPVATAPGSDMYPDLVAVPTRVGSADTPEEIS